MSNYFAQIDANNIVRNIIVAEQDFIDSGAVGEPASWVKASNENGRILVGLGFRYDAVTGLFVAPEEGEA